MQKNKFRDWVNREVDKKLDKEPFSSLPLMMRTGIFLLISSFIIGYGGPALILIISGFNENLATGLLSSTAVYIFSWVLGILGLALAGKDSIKYPVFFFAKFLKKVFPAYFNKNGGPDLNKKEGLPVSGFFILNAACLGGLITVVFLSVLFSSCSVLLSGTIILIVIHQSFYIYGMFSARTNFFFRTLKGKEFFNNKSGILFRFDDGPDPVYTPQILDILKSEGIRALFAVTGKNAEKYPDIVKRMHRENHIIANHTYSHPYRILLMGYKKVFKEISGANSVIQDITGMKPEYYCPTIGHKNHIIGRVIKELGLVPVMWDIRTLDTHLPAEKIIRKIKKELKSPAIIMFHDGILPWSRKERNSTVLALKDTIRLIKEKGYMKPEEVKL